MVCGRGDIWVRHYDNTDYNDEYYLLLAPARLDISLYEDEEAWKVIRLDDGVPYNIIIETDTVSWERAA